jgi:uncharacterized protein
MSIVEALPDTWLAYSYTRGSLVRLSPPTRRFLAGEPGAAVGPGCRARLARLGFLVPSRAEELDLVRQRLFDAHYGTGTVVCSLVLTYACNLRCPYCYESPLGRAGTMTPAVALRAVEMLKRQALASGATTVGLTLYGGEPLVNLKAAQAAITALEGWCREQRIAFAVNLITNGTLLTPEVIRSLQPALQQVQLTFEGSPAHHDRVRIGPDGRGTFDRICQAAEDALAAGVRVSLRIQLAPDGWAGAEECVAALDRRGLLQRPDVSLYFFPILDLERVCTAKESPCFRQFFSADMLDELFRIGLQHGANLFDLPKPVWERPYCSFVNQYATLVDPLGRCYKCVSAVGRPDAVTGSVLEAPEPLEASRQRANELAMLDRPGHDFERCRECECLPSCDGGCAYRALTVEGQWRVPSCEIHRELVRPEIAYYYRALVKAGRQDEVPLI